MLENRPHINNTISNKSYEARSGRGVDRKIETYGKRMKRNFFVLIHRCHLYASSCRSSVSVKTNVNIRRCEVECVIRANTRKRRKRLAIHHNDEYFGDRNISHNEKCDVTTTRLTDSKLRPPIVKATSHRDSCQKWKMKNK